MAEAAAKSAIVVRRRRRVRGASPWARRRWSSAWRLAKEAKMRSLRTTKRHVSMSVIEVSPMRRHQPREMSLEAGSLTVALERSAAERRP